MQKVRWSATAFGFLHLTAVAFDAGIDTSASNNRTGKAMSVVKLRNRKNWYIHFQLMSALISYDGVQQFPECAYEADVVPGL